MYSLILALLAQGAGQDAAAPVQPDSPTLGSVAVGTEQDAAVLGEETVEAPEDAAFDAVSVPTEEEPAILSLVAPKARPILITIDGEVGSKISEARDFFPIKLAQPVVIDGVEVLPAGIEGEGQVVHADRAGFGGRAGELILAARYLLHGDRRIDLRSFRFIEEGDELPSMGSDHTDTVLATNAVLGPLGLLIGGGNTTIAPGTLARAKFRNEEIFEITPPNQIGGGAPEK